VLKDKKSSAKAAFRAALHLFPKKYSKVFCLYLAIFFSIYLGYCTSHPPLPSKKRPLILYSSEADDLKLVYLRAIENAKKSIFLVIYGLTDSDVKNALHYKINEGLDVNIFFDPGGSKDIESCFPPGFAFPILSTGLMHKKILILDDETVFLGSANLTETSLRLHDNLVMGCLYPPLAHFLKYSQDTYFSFTLDGQEIEIFSLPEIQKRSLHKILHCIDNAQSSIQVSMFTFTHPDILASLLAAHSRGIDIKVCIDSYSARGASKKVFEILTAAAIDVSLGTRGKLLHNKWCIIDKKILIFGSTNWTSSAFSKNDDCIVILNSINNNLINKIIDK